MKLIFQHIQMNDPMLVPSDPTTSGHHKGDTLHMIVQKISCMLNCIIDLTILSCL